MKKIISVLLVITGAMSTASAMDKLSGTPIASGPSMDYTTGGPSETVNTVANLFDGNLDTYFASYAPSYSWGGLDLGSPYMIDRIGWAPRSDISEGGASVCLAVIQGANSPDWLDAVPLFLITEDAEVGKITYADINCSRGFRYIRYVTPSGKHCNLAELELYGHEGVGTDDNMFQFTNRPTVVINTVDSEEPYDKEHNIPGNVIILNNNKYDTDASASVRERGNSSRTHPKKPWRIKFDKKQRVLGAPAKAKKWTLINNHSDKTLMRNAVAFEISRRVGLEYTPFCEIVDVVLNGEFKGCYQLCDQVEAKENRIPVDEMEATDIELPALSGGYHFEIDYYAPEEPEGTWFVSDNLEIPVTLKSPDDGGTPEQMAYIRDYFNKFVDIVMRSDYNDKVTGVESILDYDQYLRYFIVQEVLANADGVFCCHMYKKRNDPLIYTGPVWDAELAFDNDDRMYPACNMNGFATLSGRGAVIPGFRTLHTRLFKNYPKISERRSKIWSDARNDNNLSAESLCDYIDSLAVEIGPSADLNFKRWDVLGRYIFSNPRAEKSFDEALGNLKSFIRDRFLWLDDKNRFAYDTNLSSVELPVSDVDMDYEITVTDGRIAVSGNSPFRVFTPSGTTCFAGTGTTGTLSPGIYIVCHGPHSTKVAIH